MHIKNKRKVGLFNIYICEHTHTLSPLSLFFFSLMLSVILLLTLTPKLTKTQTHTQQSQSMDAPRIMARLLPQIRLLLLLRNPIDRAYSEYQMKVYMYICMHDVFNNIYILYVCIHA